MPLPVRLAWRRSRRRRARRSMRARTTAASHVSLRQAVQNVRTETLPSGRPRPLLDHRRSVPLEPLFQLRRAARAEERLLLDHLQGAPRAIEERDCEPIVIDARTPGPPATRRRLLPLAFSRARACGDPPARARPRAGSRAGRAASTGNRRRPRAEQRLEARGPRALLMPTATGLSVCGARRYLLLHETCRSRSPIYDSPAPVRRVAGGLALQRSLRGVS